MPRLAPLALTALLVGTPAYAQDLDHQVDQLFSWATPDAPGCVLSAAKDRETVIERAFGMANLEDGIPLTPGTVFDIGSVQKQFIAAAVLVLVEDGRVGLADDIRTYFPELPDYGHTITVDHLLTHTSGIRDWTGLLNLASTDEDALTLVLRQRGLNFPPGDEWSYSNSGFLLLKEIVERTSGQSFNDFAQARMFEPLGMTSTMYGNDVRAAENHALAYQKQGDGWRPAMMLGEARGPGALVTSAGDLLRWNAALDNARLGRFVTDKLQEPARLNNGRELTYGRGLFLDENAGGRVIWHSGSANGYGAFLVRFPEQRISIALLCNGGDSTEGTNPRRIYELLAPGAAALDREAPPPAGSAAATGIDVSARAGLFVSERTGQPLRLGVDDGRLRIQGGPRLVAASDDRFRNPEGTLSFMSKDEFELRFTSADAFDLVSMEGEVTAYRRAVPWAPTAAEMEAFEGRWESDELGAAFTAEPGERGLLVRLNGGPPAGIEFAPVDTDTFQRAQMILRFRRDAEGNVVGLDHSNPVMRNVRFTRTSGGGEAP
jgi:CubicO group peptidase (beta-lactamase class C family)